MKDFNIINLNQLTWPLNAAIGGAVFAVFSLIYNEYYIYYGLFTVVFGIVGHISVLFFEWYFHIDADHKYVDQKYYWVAHITNVIFAMVWIAALVCFYS